MAVERRFSDKEKVKDVKAVSIIVHEVCVEPTTIFQVAIDLVPSMRRSGYDSCRTFGWSGTCTSKWRFLYVTKARQR